MKNPENVLIIVFAAIVLFGPYLLTTHKPKPQKKENIDYLKREKKSINV